MSQGRLSITLPSSKSITLFKSTEVNHVEYSISESKSEHDLEDHYERLIKTLKILAENPKAIPNSTERKCCCFTSEIQHKITYDNIFANLILDTISEMGVFTLILEELKKFRLQADRLVDFAQSKKKQFDSTKNIRSTLEDCIEQVEKVIAEAKLSALTRKKI